MPLSIIQPAFSSGEWSPSLYARVDLAKYSTALRTCRNFVLHPHGGASNRGGTEFVAEVKTSSKKVRLIPFQFSVVQAYVLEFGEYYMRIHKDGGQVVLPSTPDAWNSGTSYVHGNYCTVSGTHYYALQASSNKNPATETAYWYALTGDIVEIKTPYTEADLPLLKYTQSADVIYLTHPSYAVRKLTRTDHHVWLMSQVSFASSISAPTSLTRSSGSGSGSNYVVTAVKDGEESVASSSVSGGAGDTFTWGTVSGADYYNFYKDANGGGHYGWIGQATNATFKEPSAGIVPDEDASPPIAQGLFNSTNNYPGCATFFEQRLVFARTNASPQTLWGSVVGSFENMNISSPLRDDDSYEFTINALQVNEVKWLLPLNELLIGTAGTEWKMGPGGNSDAVTPTSVQIRMQSKWGSSDLQPILIGNSILFVGAAKNVVRDLMYSLEVDGFQGNNLSLLSEHLLRDRQIVDWAFQQAPYSTIWSVRDDGVLLGLTYAREHELWGWSRHDTDGEIEAIASIQTGTTWDEVYIVVNRTIGGSTKRYVERLMPRLPEDDVVYGWFVDSGLQLDSWNTTTTKTFTLSAGSPWAAGDTATLTATGHTPFSGGSVGDRYWLRLGEDSVQVEVTAYTSSSVVTVVIKNRPVPSTLQAVATYDWALMVTTLSGLSHLEGESLVALVDGNVVRNLTVSSGAVTLPNAAAVVTIGLPYTCDLETMELNVDTPGGTLQDRQRDINSLLIRLENSRGYWAGPNEDRLEEQRFRTDENYGDPITLYTGDKEQSIWAGDGRSARIFLRTVDPVPLTVLAVIPRIVNGDF